MIALLFKVLIWLLACHHKNYAIFIYLLEDEQELSLGMFIRPKRIYNFCLLHACFVCYCYDLDTVSYTFDHIWTNLLTQCTTVPVPVFCYFSISVFPHMKSAPKIREKSDKKSAQRKLAEPQRRARGAPPGAQAARWCDLGWGRAGRPPGHLVAPLAAPFAYISLSSRNP